MNSFTMTAAACLSMAALTAQASVTISVGGSAPTYATVLNFDEPGGPTGTVPTDAWASIGVSSVYDGVDQGFVGNLNGQPGFGWLPDNNVIVGNFGMNFDFSTALTELSAQVWDNAGPATFITGGMVCVVRNGDQEVGNFFWENPVYGTAGDNWFNITATDGTVFDSVSFFGLAFGFPETIVDNVSFNPIPAPGAMGFALTGLGLLARRRRG